MNRSIALAAALSLLAGVAAAQEAVVGGLRIFNPWARATPRGSEVGGAYLTIRNTGTDADRFLGGTTAVAKSFEVHQMAMDKGVMQMRPVQGGLEIKPGQAVELKPGSFHIMMMGLKQPLERGQRVKATLEFEKAGKVDVESPIEAIGSNGPAAKGPTPKAPMDHGARTGH